MSNTTRLTIATVLGALGSAPAATLTLGHVDAIGIGYEAGAIEPHIHADPAAVVDGSPVGNGPDGAEFGPDKLIIAVPQSTYDYIQTTGGRAGGAQWNPIGVAAGQSYWFLPQSSTLADTLGAPFAGIATEDLTPDTDWSTPLSVTLTSATMPPGGQFALAQVDLGVPTFFMATLGGIDASDTLDIPADAHRHYNWYFTVPGTYELSFEISGIHAQAG
jgi:surface-anchored protein